MSPLLLVLIVLVIVAPAVAFGIRAGRTQHHRLLAAQPTQQPRMPASPHPDDALVQSAHRLARAYSFDPTRVVDVDEGALIKNPEDWHAQEIRVTTTWSHQFESSTIGPAFVQRHDNAGPVARGVHRVRAAGLWLCPRAPRSTRSKPGFGHLGMSWAEFHIHELELLSSDSREP